VPEALGKLEKHSAQALPSVALSKEGSVNSTSAKPSLPSTFSRALGTDFAECQTVLGKEKPSSRCRDDGDDVFLECLLINSAKKLLFAECLPANTRQRILSGSLCQVLCRVQCRILGKAFLFAECQVHRTRQRTYTGVQVLVLCRVL
jgi:hypothetical protein